MRMGADTCRLAPSEETPPVPALLRGDWGPAAGDGEIPGKAPDGRPRARPRARSQLLARRSGAPWRAPAGYGHHRHRRVLRQPGGHRQRHRLHQRRRTEQPAEGGRHLEPRPAARTQTTARHRRGALVAPGNGRTAPATRGAAGRAWRRLPAHRGARDLALGYPGGLWSHEQPATRPDTRLAGPDASWRRSGAYRASTGWRSFSRTGWPKAPATVMSCSGERLRSPSATEACRRIRSTRTPAPSGRSRCWPSPARTRDGGAPRCSYPIRPMGPAPQFSPTPPLPPRPVIGIPISGAAVPCWVTSAPATHLAHPRAPTHQRQARPRMTPTRPRMHTHPAGGWGGVEGDAHTGAREGAVLNGP